MRRGTTVRLPVGVVALLLALSTPMAAEVAGSIQVSGGTNKNELEKIDVLDEKYQITLVQPVTPFLQVNVNFRYRGLETRPELSPDFERRTSQPGIDVSYSRNRFSTQLVYVDRRTRGTNPVDTLDATSFFATATWDPERGPLSRIEYRDQTNYSNVAVFGRDVTSETWALNVGRDYQDWSAWYEYRRVDMGNALSGLQLDQEYHELRGSYQARAWEDRIAMFASGRVRRSDRDTRAPTGSTFDQPVPAITGLFAVDTTPESWRLDPAPQLTDGDVDTPVSPDIDIGGANTFRNIGIDLGFTRPVSQLEVTVDRLSGPGLVWEVYHSPDNLNWELVPGVTSLWDTTFLRYSIRFPEIEDQYFKAVNVSVNTESVVLVTEIRALREVEGTGRVSGRSTDVRTDLNLLFRPNERVDANFSLGYYDEDDIIPGVTIRGLQDLYYSSSIRVILSPDWDLDMYTRYNHREEDLDPVLERSDKGYGAGLNWKPLPAVDGRLNVQRREEREWGRPLRTDDTVRLVMATELYPELLLTSELLLADSENILGGFTQSLWTWRETLSARPTRHWNLSGSYSYTDFDSTGTRNIGKRTSLTLRTTWLPVQAIRLGATFRQGKEDQAEVQDQQAFLSWAPGRKLTVSFNYNRTESVGLRTLTSAGAGLQYRPHRRLRLFVTGYRSEEEVATLPAVEITSVRAGLNLTL